MNFFRKHCWLVGWGKNLSLALLLTLGPCGCKEGAHGAAQKGEEKEKTEATGAIGVKFKAGKGLLLPEETQKAIGLEIAEVSDEKFAPQISVQAEVYRAADGSSPALALARVKPDVARQLQVGQAVKVQSPNGELATGNVVRLDSQTEKFLGQTEVLLEIPDANARYPIGARLVAIFDLGEAKSVTAVPRSAVLSASEGPFVYVVNGQHFLRTLIKVGGHNKEWVEVTDGLFAGDKIVTRPVETLWMTELRAVKGGGDVD